MKRFTDFLKSKGFYIALGTGVLAFAGLLAMYNYDSTKKEMLEEPAIDLNQPAQLDDEPDVDTPELKAEVEVDETSPVGSDSAIADEEKNDPSEEAADGEAEQETIKVQNQTKILEAQADAQAKQIAAEAEAKANSTISASLTDKLLKKMEMEAREKHGWVTVQGGTVVTDTK